MLTAVLPLLAAACSTAGNYPSLAIRDVERASGSAAAAQGEAAPPMPALPPASADLVTRLDALVALARAADRNFQSNRAAAERSVVGSGGVGTDSWSDASIALARLESSRSQAMVALADLDTLYVDARTEAPLEESPSAKAIGAARDEVSAWVAAQDEVIGRLASRLRS
jgi:hypothetical protein